MRKKGSEVQCFLERWVFKWVNGGKINYFKENWKRICKTCLNECTGFAKSQLRRNALRGEGPGEESHTWPLFGFGGFRLMTEWKEWAHQRRINDSCVKRSLSVSSSHIHLNLAGWSVRGNELLTTVCWQDVLEELDLICHTLGPLLLIRYLPNGPRCWCVCGTC